MNKKAKCLVIDSGPMLKSAYDLHMLATEFFTVPEVLKELKDKATRDTLERLPYSITLKTPSEESIKFIVDFSKKSGDYASLSLTDIKILALTLQFEWEKNGKENLRSEPVSTQQNAPKKKNRNKNKNKSNEKAQVEKEESNSSIMKDSSDLTKDVPETDPVEKLDIPSLDINNQDSSSDDGEWITPTNITRIKEKNSQGSAAVHAKKPECVEVACITNDFAMQKILLQIKLSLLSTDGMLITRVKSSILRCHACFKTTHHMERTFCPSCGNATLLRVTVGVDHNGANKVFLKKNFQFRNRGTVYSIPATKGGRNANNLILREDQNEHHKALMLKKRFEKKSLNHDADIDSFLLFGAKQLTAAGNPVIGYGRKNPNEVRGRRRK